MTQNAQKLPIYTRVWNQLKHAPGLLSQGSKTPPPVHSGAAVAALLSGGIGAVTMMVSHHFSDTNKSIENVLHNVVGAWMPGAVSADPMWGNIGSYAGKETMMLVGWLGSWLVLHFLLRNRDVSARAIFIGMFGLFTLATAMAWHPLFHYLPLM
jgi:hypothetical protein